MKRMLAAGGCVVAGTLLGVSAPVYNGQWLLGFGLQALGLLLLIRHTASQRSKSWNESNVE